MSKSIALAPIEQREVEFYDDRIVAVLLPVEGQEQPAIYVPVRPVCEFLGLDWRSQRHRIDRDPVLSEVKQGVVIMTPPSAEGRGGGPQEMICLPLDKLYGWLFGVQASRVKAEYRESIIRYQREVYQVLWHAFRPDRSAEFEARLATTETRLDQAAAVVGDLRKRLTVVEERVAPGQPITQEQAAEIGQAVKALAMLLTEADPTKNHFQGVWGEVNRRMGVASYKNIPATRYGEVMAFLEEWRDRMLDQAHSKDPAG
jgi:hypothetical protein